mgnify:CR=1 FL=1
MRISVIIPVLNEEKSIAATLLELQRLKPDELILVDGGSSDGTWKFAKDSAWNFTRRPAGGRGR